MSAITLHLPILIVLIPFVAAYLLPVISYFIEGWARRITLIAVGGTLLSAFMLLAEVAASGPVTYHLSGIAPPLGIAFETDYLGITISVVILAIGLLTILYAQDPITEIGGRKTVFFYTAILLAVGAMQGIVICADIFTLFILLEILAIAMYGLVALGGDGRGLLAGYKYLLIGSAGSAFILIGIGFLYISTGTLNMQLMAEILPPISSSWTVLAGIALLIAGLSTKTGLFPLHIWMPDAYAYAPSIAPVISTLALKAGLVALIRIIYTVSGPVITVDQVPLQSILALLGALAIVVCSIMAIRQIDIRKMFAYSSGANIGCVVLGMSIGTLAGLEGAILLIITHALAKACLFLCADVLLIQAGIRTIFQFRGLGQTMPYTMGAFSMAAISIIGIPLSGGFMSKVYVANAAIDSGLWIYAGTILFWTLLTALYFFRIINSAYFDEPDLRTRPHDPRRMNLIPIMTLAVASILIGFLVEIPMDLIRPAAMLLLPGGGI